MRGQGRIRLTDCLTLTKAVITTVVVVSLTGVLAAPPFDTGPAVSAQGTGMQWEAMIEMNPGQVRLARARAQQKPPMQSGRRARHILRVEEFQDPTPVMARRTIGAGTAHPTVRRPHTLAG